MHHKQGMGFLLPSFSCSSITPPSVDDYDFNKQSRDLETTTRKKTVKSKLPGAYTSREFLNLVHYSNIFVSSCSPESETGYCSSLSISHLTKQQEKLRKDLHSGTLKQVSAQ